MFSVILLLSMGVIKLLFTIFDGNVSERNVHIRIEMGNKQIECNALVDSGNLAKDPVDETPVLLIKRDVAEGLFVGGIPELHNGNFPEKYKRYIRLIPVNLGEKNEILLGFRPDRVYVIGKKREERIKITIALDNNGGTYGGFEALMPISALENL